MCSKRLSIFLLLEVTVSGQKEQAKLKRAFTMLIALILINQSTLFTLKLICFSICFTLRLHDTPTLCISNMMLELNLQVVIYDISCQFVRI